MNVIKLKKYHYLSLLVVFVAIIADQWTKWLAVKHLLLYQPVAILPLFNLTLAFNDGAAFSFLSNAGGWQRWFFIVLSLGISILLIIWIYQLMAQQRWTRLFLSLILGGAIGNLIDRILAGYVVDFLDVYYQSWHWPTFNIADSCITVGAIGLILSSWNPSSANT